MGELVGRQVRGDGLWDFSALTWLCLISGNGSFCEVLCQDHESILRDRADEQQTMSGAGLRWVIFENVCGNG